MPFTDARRRPLCEAYSHFVADLSPLTTSQHRILSALDTSKIATELSDLIRVPSVTGSASESELSHLLAQQLTDDGFIVDHWEIDIAHTANDPQYPGTEADRKQAFGLVAVTATDPEPGLILQGHLDVVPPGDPSAWAGMDPFSGLISDGWVHGRGAADMKGGVAAILAASRAVARSGVRLRAPLAIHLVVSEEDGGLGAFATLKRGHRGAAAIIAEPTRSQLIVANAGALTFRITVPGKAAHGSSRYEGVSAFDAFLPVYRALQEWERQMNAERSALFGSNPLPYPLSVGTIHAGDWASTVPDVLVADGRVGVPLGVDPEQIRIQVAEVISEACSHDDWLRGHPATVHWVGGQFASGQIEAGHPLIGHMSDAVTHVTGVRPQQSAAPYGSDLRLYSGMAGIPTLHFGPGDIRHAHAAGERISIREVEQAAQALSIVSGSLLTAPAE